MTLEELTLAYLKASAKPRRAPGGRRMSALTHAGQPAGPEASRSRERGGARLADLAWLTWRQHRTVIIAGLAIAAAVTGSIALRCRAHHGDQPGVRERGLPGGSVRRGARGLLRTDQSDDLPHPRGDAPAAAGRHVPWRPAPGPRARAAHPAARLEPGRHAAALAVDQARRPRRDDSGGGRGGIAASGHLAAVASIATGQSLFSGNAFLVSGMLPLVQSVVWLAVGVALGAAFRRTLPAIFTALVGYGAAYLLVERAYPSFMTPLTALAPLGSDQGSAAQFGPTAWSSRTPQARSTTHPATPSARPCSRSASPQTTCPRARSTRAWRRSATS